MKIDTMVLLLGNIITFCGIIASIIMAVWQIKREHRFLTRPLLYAAIYNNLYYNGNNCKRSGFNRLIVYTDNYILLLNKMKNNSKKNKYKKYKFFRLVNHFNYDALDVKVKLEKQINNQWHEFETYYCYRLNKSEEIMILIPPDENFDSTKYKYNFQKIRATITYNSLAGEYFIYRYIYPVDETINIRHEYCGYKKEKRRIKSEFIEEKRIHKKTFGETYYKIIETDHRRREWIK